MIQVAAFEHRNHRAEDFFLGDTHLRSHIRENRGLDEVAVLEIAFIGATPSAHELSFVLDAADLDVFQDLFDCVFVYDRTYVGLLVKPRP